MSDKMKKRISWYLNLLMGIILIGFPFSVWYQYNNWNHSPLLFRMNAAPWYVRSISDGVLVLVAIAGCLLVKWGLKNWGK